MKYGLSILVFLITCCSCRKQRNEAGTAIDSLTTLSADSVPDKEIIDYSDHELELFLDSIGKLPTKSLADKVASGSDSSFRSPLHMDREISVTDFNRLKKAIQSGTLDYATAVSIFGTSVDTTHLDDGVLPVTFFSFDKGKDDFNEYAICLGYPDARWGCTLYFFRSNRIISKHTIYHRYGLELKHYTDSDGKTVIYYLQNYESGSGIWWFNFYFYKYYDDELIPILNEVENANLQFPWSVRVLWLESVVLKTNPLTLKMVYYQAFSDSVVSPRFVDDSTIVRYTWDERTRTLQGHYEESSISRSQILSYYLTDNELLFINTHYSTLKTALLSEELRPHTFNYLNAIKNHYRKSVR